MKFPDPLIKATLVRRYKRFLADCILDNGEEVTVHCPNSGRMTGLDEPGFTVWLSRKPDGGKLKYGMELVDTGGGNLVGVNTMRPNQIVAEALAQSQLKEFADYTTGLIKREVPYGHNSRVDFLLTAQDHPDYYLEIKNVHMRRVLDDGRAALLFPDAVTARGAKHMFDLAEAVQQGERAGVLFLCQRDDADIFTIAGDIDPAYHQALLSAQKSGVAVMAYTCKMSLTEITINKAIKVEL